MNAKELEDALAAFDQRWQSAVGPQSEDYTSAADHASALRDWMTRHDEARAYLVDLRDTARYMERLK